jgi:hypothetical protein
LNSYPSAFHSSTVEGFDPDASIFILSFILRSSVSNQNNSLAARFSSFVFEISFSLVENSSSLDTHFCLLGCSLFCVSLSCLGDSF